MNPIYFLRSEAIVMSFFVTRPKKVTHPRSKVDADLNWCRTLLCFCHLQLCSTTNECWAIQILKEVVRFLLPRKSQKLEFLAERFNFLGWQQVLTSKNLSNHNRSYLLPILKFPNFPAWLLLLTGGSIFQGEMWFMSSYHWGKIQPSKVMTMKKRGISVIVVTRIHWPLTRGAQP